VFAAAALNVSLLNPQQQSQISRFADIIRVYFRIKQAYETQKEKDRERERVRKREREREAGKERQ